MKTLEEAIEWAARRPHEVRELARGSAAGSEILEVCEGIGAFLAEKNAAYGNSALEPLRIFSRASPQEQILVRLDDKLSRLSRGHAAGEDVIMDLIGYLVLLVVCERRLRADVPDSGREAGDRGLRDRGGNGAPGHSQAGGLRSPGAGAPGVQRGVAGADSSDLETPAGMTTPRRERCQDCGEPSGDGVICESCRIRKGFHRHGEKPSERTSEGILWSNQRSNGHGR